MKVLWICTVWPEPTSSAAGFRTLRLVRALQKRGHSQCVVSPAKDNVFRNELEQKGIETYNAEPNDSAFDQFLLERVPDVVIFDRFMMEEQFSWRVRLHAPNATRILDTVDLHSLRRLRERRFKKGLDESETLERVDMADDTLRELAAIWRSDLSLITSTTEMKLLQRTYGVAADLLLLCSFGYEVQPISLGFKERSNIVFIGNFNHKPNADAVHFLQNSLWGQIRSACARVGIPDCELHIYGAYTPQQLRGSNGIRIKGCASNAYEVLSQYRVNLAPLRFGAGIKGKISDGWFVGTPCVGTSCAAEGMHDNLEFGGTVVDNPAEFAEAVAQLYVDEISWAQASERGVTIINTLFSAEAYERSFVDGVEQAHSTREDRRSRNFIGELLWYESNRSTEYFSRWIESKNRNLSST
jgi:glycosyltransferase involved in cell wall biosynthesis